MELLTGRWIHGEFGVEGELNFLFGSCGHRFTVGPGMEGVQWQVFQ